MPPLEPLLAVSIVVPAPAPVTTWPVVPRGLRVPTPMTAWLPAAAIRVQRASTWSDCAIQPALLVDDLDALKVEHDENEQRKEPPGCESDVNALTDSHPIHKNSQATTAGARQGRFPGRGAHLTIRVIHGWPEALQRRQAPDSSVR